MPTSERILVVEDEDRQRATLKRHLERDGFEVIDANSAEAGRELLAQQTFAALVTDLRLPGASGLELVQWAREYDEEIPAVVMTAYASVETAVEALRAGAHDYILKPLFFAELSRKLRRALEHRDLIRENARLRSCLREAGAAGQDLLGDSAAVAEVRDWISRAARTDATVLICGETGTGKEIVAHSIHAAGANAESPMLTVNVAALAANMIESELFGHERGAFTGAQRQRDGILRSAGKGTVFLDEIGELPLDLQAKMLRALEAREVLPVGSDRPVPFDARIIAATHRDLKARAAQGTFREDLYYRLDVLRIEVPPLRERQEDVPALAQHLCSRIAQRHGRAAPILGPETVRALQSYAWPGNVRELANVIERAMILSDTDRIEPTHLPRELSPSSQASGELSAGPAADASTELKAAVAEFERRHIAHVLRACNGNREQAAKDLGLSPATLYRRLDKLDLKGDRAQDVEP